MSQKIDYGNLMHEAMRGLIQKVLARVADEGLPGQHHFFITFDTMHPDVELADWLSDRYPGEMTIVLEHWFDALTVPYDAIRTFVDPSVEFGLRFETQEDDFDDEDDDDEAPMVEMAEEEPKPRKEAEVVSLDQFRK